MKSQKSLEPGPEVTGATAVRMLGGFCVVDRGSRLSSNEAAEDLRGGFGLGRQQGPAPASLFSSLWLGFVFQGKVSSHWSPDWFET